MPLPKITLSKPYFTMLIAITSLSSTFLGLLVFHYVADPFVSSGAAVFISGVGAALVTFFTELEKAAPPVVPNP